MADYSPSRMPHEWPFQLATGHTPCIGSRGGCGSGCASRLIGSTAGKQPVKICSPEAASRQCLLPPPFHTSPFFARLVSRESTTVADDAREYCAALDNA